MHTFFAAFPVRRQESGTHLLILNQQHLCDPLESGFLEMIHAAPMTQFEEVWQITPDEGAPRCRHEMVNDIEACVHVVFVKLHGAREWVPVCIPLRFHISMDRRVVDVLLMLWKRRT